jgi:hypothetical protein
MFLVTNLSPTPGQRDNEQQQQNSFHDCYAKLEMQGA